LWDSKTNKNSCKIGTLIHFAKLSDEKKFYDTYIQHNSSSELNKSDIALAQIYLDILGDNLFYQDKKIYIYLQNEWWCDTEGHFVKKNFFTEMTKYYAKLKDEINKQINEIEGEEGKEDEVEGLLAQIEEIKECKSHIYKVNTLNNVLSAIKTLMATLKEEIIFDTNEEQIYNIHFKNGVFDLNTNTFRQRNKDDYVSMYLSWDYEPEIVTDEAKAELWDSICKIEPCPERRKCLLSYLAYSLTGDCSKQKYLNLIGYTAANGKSHTFKMMSKCFEFYTKKLSSNIFNMGNEKRHKEIIHLYQNPVRFAFIEELDNKKKLDAEYMKDIVDGSKVPVEVMYGTSVDVALQAKIITSSNGDPNIKMDDAILRRIVNLYLKSQFVEIEEDDWENRKFVRKDGAEKMFDCPIMKNAVFELLTRHEFKEFVIPDCVKNDTKDTADILNDFKDRFEAHYDITKNPEDVVNKHDFMEVLKISKTDLKKTISEMRQIGVDYNKDRKKDKVKGCFVGLKEIGSGEYLGEI
jgi:phage/plasmid-associated DNA primase